MNKLFQMRSPAAAVMLAAFTIAASAQGSPGGGMNRGEGPMRGMNRPESRSDPARPREPVLQPHTMGLFAEALEKEAPSLALTPAAAAATSEFVRELKDFAAIDDRHVRERVGFVRTVRATINIERDLNESLECTRARRCDGGSSG